MDCHVSNGCENLHRAMVATCVKAPRLVFLHFSIFCLTWQQTIRAWHKPWDIMGFRVQWCHWCIECEGPFLVFFLYAFKIPPRPFKHQPVSVSAEAWANVLGTETVPVTVSRPPWNLSSLSHKKYTQTWQVQFHSIQKHFWPTLVDLKCIWKDMTQNSPQKNL